MALANKYMCGWIWQTRVRQRNDERRDDGTPRAAHAKALGKPTNAGAHIYRRNPLHMINSSEDFDAVHNLSLDDGGSDGAGGTSRAVYADSRGNKASFGVNGSVGMNLGLARTSGRSSRSSSGDGGNQLTVSLSADFANE